MVTTLPAPGVVAADARLPGGPRLRYLDGGPAEGPALLMLHGLTDSSYSFSRVLPLVPSHMRVIVPDQRGHGDSDRPHGGYGVDEFATDALQLLDLLGIERAAVVGHSMGSFVARRIAERAPWRVSRLVLIGTANTARNQTIADLLVAIDALGDPVDEDFIRAFQTSTINRPVPAEFLSGIIAESRKVPKRVFKAAAEGLVAYQPQWPITCPTTIIGGEEDPVFSREEQRDAWRHIPNATLSLVPGIGHAFHWEAPEQFVRLAL